MSVFGIASSMAAAAQDAHGEAASSGLPQLDPAWWPSQLFWLALTFGVLYLLMSGRFLPAIGGAIEERRDRIADDLDKASESKKNAESAEAAYNQSLADARARAQTIAAQTRADVDAEIAKMQAETDESLEKNLGAAENRIEEMKIQAGEKVKAAAADAAVAVVEALIDESPTTDVALSAVEDAAARQPERRI